MVSSQFESLLKEFELFFNCPLQPDNNNSCRINLTSGIHVQIEMNRFGQILIGSRLGTLPMGRYRENLIRQALKSNEATIPSTGIFGFSHKSNQLILFMNLNPQYLNGDFLKTLLSPFMEKTKIWKESIEKGDIPVVESTIGSKGTSGLFGLIS